MALRFLTQDQVDFYKENGYLRIPQVFNPTEIQEMGDELNKLVEVWALNYPGWSGPWRRVYMDETTEKKSKLIAMHDLSFYSATWTRAVANQNLVSAVSDLLGPNVELHHSTMHIKPPETGHPFPMHQDNAFYEHTNHRYLDVLVHLDDTNPENGEIRFLPGSHKNGALPHITQLPTGESCTPHLPTEKYSLEDTVPVPASRGDIVVFNIFTIHGSFINHTDKARRLVRIGYRDPENSQISGQSFGRPGLIVSGFRPRAVGQSLFQLT
eukprot:TRINITY_DN7852_c0_g1_i3.p1 TRINITY_DN7852_c0_g1~~TRINITY_DN7852_c0_g1_i3.p1  ORF type:complete len:268 (-),score=26.41 TRINITY_DN7852_c0_g1_i3:7-810(-)